MKKFLSKILIFAIPFIIAIILLIGIDPYKVFFNYENYYENNIIELNREMVTSRTYDNFRDEVNFNSFIFGSSRSQAFRCEDWLRYLDDGAIPFHFDAHGEGIYGIAKKVEYIDNVGGILDNVLIVLDRTVLSVTENRKSSHLYISPPSLTKQSSFYYYYSFLKGQFNYNFLLSFFDYLIFEEYRNYMEGIILNPKYPNISNRINCDIYYGKEVNIKLDSIGYYHELIEKEVFYKRPKEENYNNRVTQLELEHLETIISLLDKHKTKYKIIISPNYDQAPLEKEQLELLNHIFGKNNVYDFSGKNSFTEKIGNYYEDSHFRPFVARKILELVYKE